MYFKSDCLPANSSVPPSVVVPILPYPDVRKAAEWLCDTFGFVERLQVAEHRAQLVFGSGAMIVAEYIGQNGRPSEGAKYETHQIMVRVKNVQAHFDRTASRGAEILEAITEHIFGERQYVVRDIGGHRWTFSETVRDAHPSEWGGDDVILKVASTP